MATPVAPRSGLELTVGVTPTVVNSLVVLDRKPSPEEHPGGDLAPVVTDIQYGVL